MNNHEMMNRPDRSADMAGHAEHVKNVADSKQAISGNSIVVPKKKRRHVWMKKIKGWFSQKD